MKQPVIVIGLGSVLLSDEGIGIHLLRALEAYACEFPEVEFADLGTAGMRVLHAIADRRTAIILDCALMDEPAGTLRRFTPDEARSIKCLPGFSLHEGDLFQVLSLSRQHGELPDRVVIFGVQPEILEPGQELSPLLAARLPQYVRDILSELRQS